RGGNVVALCSDQLDQRFDEEVLAESGHRHPGRRTVEAARVHLGTGEGDLSIVVAISFEALEDLLRIVKRDGRGMEVERIGPLNARVVPLAVGVLHSELIRAEERAERTHTRVKRRRRRAPGPKALGCWE